MYSTFYKTINAIIALSFQKSKQTMPLKGTEAKLRVSPGSSVSSEAKFPVAPMESASMLIIAVSPVHLPPDDFCNGGPSQSQTGIPVHSRLSEGPVVRGSIPLTLTLGTLDEWTLGQVNPWTTGQTPESQRHASADFGKTFILRYDMRQAVVT